MAPLLAPTAVSPLTFGEVQRLIESSSSCVRLAEDLPADSTTVVSKGRYLLARRDIQVGEVILSEEPLFCGDTSGLHSQKVYVKEFNDRRSECSWDLPLAELEDCLHPCSPLVDCVAGIILAKSAASGCASGQSGQPAADMHEAHDRLQKFDALCRSASIDLVPRDCAKDVFKMMLPEFQALSSEDELHGVLHALSSNRFSGSRSEIEVMFGGSMFEHSCAANCFVADLWRQASDAASPEMVPREYRALRLIKEGEALSIDYLGFPGSYRGVADRRQLLSGWGFECACPRCTSGPEITRAFCCPFCDLPELCPQAGGSRSPLVCRACGKRADEDYANRCLAAEAKLIECSQSGSFESQEQSTDFDGLITCQHFTVFDLAWQRWSQGPDVDDANSLECLDEYTDAVDTIIECLCRLFDGDILHPHLLRVYHARALLALNDLELQREYLDRERAVIRRFYPDEAELQDAEILHMVLRRGPPGAASRSKGGGDDCEVTSECDISGDCTSAAQAFRTGCATEALSEAGTDLHAFDMLCPARMMDTWVLGEMD